MSAVPRAPGNGLQKQFVLGSFLLTGAMAVSLGPLIPVFEGTWQINHGQSGSLFLMQFSASSVGAILSSLHLRRSLVAGYALAALALILLIAGGWPLARLAMAVLGFAMGLLIAGSNLLVAHQNPHNRGPALAALNLAWGIGAVASPLLFASLAGSIGAFGLLGVYAALAALASLGLGVTLENVEIHSSDASSGLSAAPLLILAVIALLLFFYVGVENAIGGWLIALSDQMSVDRSAVSLIIGSGFWGALLTGRALAVLALKRTTEATVFWVSLIVAALGVGCLLFVESRAGVAAGALLSGLGLAPLYPLIVSVLAEATSEAGSRLAGLVLAFGGLGGALLPWLTGRFSETATDALTASLSRGFWIPMLGLFAIAALYATVRRRQTSGAVAA